MCPYTCPHTTRTALTDFGEIWHWVPKPNFSVACQRLPIQHTLHQDLRAFTCSFSIILKVFVPAINRSIDFNGKYRNTPFTFFLSLSLSLYIYIYVCVYVHIYIFFFVRLHDLWNAWSDRTHHKPYSTLTFSNSIIRDTSKSLNFMFTIPKCWIIQILKSYQSNTTVVVDWYGFNICTSKSADCNLIC